MSERHRRATRPRGPATAAQPIDHRTRIIAMFGVLCVGFALIVYRLLCLQIWWSPAYREIAREQHKTKVRIEARRGSISDRYGRVLASTQRVYAAYANPAKVEDPVYAAETLAPYLQRSPRQLYTQLTAPGGFVYLNRQVSEPVAAHLRQLDVPGVGLEAALRRSYPNGALASTVLGFAGLDNEGLEGLEFRYDEWLRGRPGWRLTTRDVYGRSLPALTRIHSEPQPGANLRLTLDQVVQYHTEQVLRRVLREQGARSVTAVAMEPATGALLAMVSLPDYDPNAYASSQPAVRRNRAVTDFFEPGSVFKIVPAVAALEAGVVDATTPVYCEDGWYRYYRHVINDVHPLGTVPFAEVFAQSSNIGIVKVTNRLAPEDLHAQIQAFGFGARTGIRLAGESPGLYRDPQHWSKLSMGALPIGQEIGVTTLQLATAYAALANDGVRMRPYVVAAVRGADGAVLHQTEPEAVARVCSPSTARQVRHLLARVVAEGTGTAAAIPGYSVGGKTGTAQKTDPTTGRYSKTDFVAVFAGMVPAERPRFVLVVVVDSPAGVWGGKVAAPAFRDIAQELVQYLEIPPDLPVPDDDVDPVLLASHPAEEPMLPPETYLTAGLMPDLSGRTMRDVLTLLATYPVDVQLSGSGLAVYQDPPPGEPLQNGMTCAVEFAAEHA